MFCFCAVLLIQVKMRKSEKHHLLGLWFFFFAEYLNYHHEQ